MRSRLLLFASLTLAFDPGAAAAKPRVGEFPLSWRLSTSSPDFRPQGNRDSALYAVCGRDDAALAQVASRNARRQATGAEPFGSDELAFTLRASGSPEVWPRAWSIESDTIAEADARARLTKWISGARVAGERRCGIAHARTDAGREILSVVMVDALADLEPLPTLARVGEWLTLRARMIVPATEAKLVLLGPRGRPKTVLASLSGDDIRGTFAVDQPGTWLVQILATVSTGPRPVLEALVHAGNTPNFVFAETPAPGEDVPKGGGNDDEIAFAMVTAARRAEALGPLTRDPELDQLAIVHSREMLQQKMVGHDVGSGDPRQRLEAIGRTQRIGENVAVAVNLERAHRALWSSPSHRGNLLDKSFTHVGIGVVRATDGRVWVTQLFTD